MSGNDGRVTLYKPVEQCRLAGIGRAKNRYPETIPNTLANMSVPQTLGKSVAQTCAQRVDVCGLICRRFIFIGKIYRRFQQGQHFCQLLAPGCISGRKAAFQLTKRLILLRPCSGFDKISNAFGLNEIKLASLKSAACEFPGLGQAHPGKSGQGLEHVFNGADPAMQMKFQYILTCIAGRAWHIDDQTLINAPAGHVLNQLQRCLSWLRQTLPEQRFPY